MPFSQVRVLLELVNQLKVSPQTGTSIGANCYKIRLSIKSKSKGKSGGARVITHIAISNRIVYLISIYDKSEKADLTKGELEVLLKEIEN